MKVKKGQKGASAVEFALVLPLLLVILFGIVEFGLLFYNQQLITNASREGARFGVVATTTRKTLDEIKLTVRNFCYSNLIGFPKGTLGTTLTPGGPCINYGDILTVNVTYDYRFLVFPNVLALIKGSFSNSSDLKATTVMKCE